jgi:hypothetical protein
VILADPVQRHHLIGLAVAEVSDHQPLHQLGTELRRHFDAVLSQLVLEEMMGDVASQVCLLNDPPCNDAIAEAVFRQQAVIAHGVPCPDRLLEAGQLFR